MGVDVTGLGSVFDFGKVVVDKIWPDAGEAEKNKVIMCLQEFNAQADIVKTEAASQSWLTCNWRPIVMITFTGLIVARWFGWAAPNLTEAEYLKLWDIVQLGLGGYVIGRSMEKVIPSVAAALNRGK